MPRQSKIVLIQNSSNIWAINGKKIQNNDWKSHGFYLLRIILDSRIDQDSRGKTEENVLFNHDESINLLCCFDLIGCSCSKEEGVYLDNLQQKNMIESKICCTKVVISYVVQK